MPDAHKNFAYSTVLTAPSPASSGTSLVVQSGDGAKFPAVPFNASVWPAGVQPLTTTAEIVRVTAISTDTFTITRARESTGARTIVVGDQIAATITAKTLHDAEGGISAGLRGATGALWTPYDRRSTPTNQALAAAGSGTLRLLLADFPKDLPVSSIMFHSGGTAASVPLNQWAGIFSVGRVPLALTADDTTNAWAANADKIFPITGAPYIIPDTGPYYVGLLVKATTPPTLEGTTALGGSTSVRNNAPISAGNSTTTLTDPASCTGVQTVVSVAGNYYYWEIY